ncbi:ABC transporter ATP-binding protein [Streptomyces longwoodensis]|uniref:ABC transporter ATP-binding protein n=1 Tax=Streptomyces longwoodensis TaxID=68231 RepID=UPI002DD9485F|nr:ABC transporter ATP-binding protein [Streptomyces longwoodensis]WRY91063.1 ABC transporter ATP-binding protein [Streptomyces longwoodensis]
MIQAFGLTSVPRKDLPPAVDDVSFEARVGHVTALLGPQGAGKTTVLRLMLELQQGRGITHFRGRPLHHIAHPSREVGVLLGDVPGHPGRTVRGHLRMLCAAAGVPARRADEVLEAVGLVSLREERLGTLSRGMDRRLGLACALLPGPHTLVLDAPGDGLSGQEARWLYDMLKAHAARGGTVLLTMDDPKDAARTADHVITLEQGRVVADQDAQGFARTRLRPRVVVRTPHAARLAAVLTREARAAQCSVQVVQDSGNRLSVYGSSCAQVGETAFRHGVLVHQLADEVGDLGPGAMDVDLAVPASAAVTEGERASIESVASADRAAQAGEIGGDQPAAMEEGRDSSLPVVPPPLPLPPPHPAPPREEATPRPSPVPLPELPPPISVRPAPSPLRPLRYELRRAAGISTGFLTAGAVLLTSVVMALFLARIGHTPQERLLAAWPVELPLPPAALGAGLLGALAFGDEFRHPALAADRGTVPRRLGLLSAKLLVAAATALMLAFVTVGCDAEALYLVYGREFVKVPGEWLSMGASWIGLVVGCAWAGVLAAGVFRSTTAGLAAVLAVPVVVVPVVHKAWGEASVRSAAGLPMRMRQVFLYQWPFGGERYLSAVARVIAQPVGGALTLSLTVLLCAYVLTTLRSRVR